MGRKLLNPCVADLLDKIRRADRASLHSMTVPEARQAYESASEVLELPRAAVLALDCRLAPEHRFRPAVDDSWAALRRVGGQAASLGHDALRLASAGDSPWRTLATVCAIDARDVDLPLRRAFWT
jgi:acetyl esterase/lipase